MRENTDQNNSEQGHFLRSAAYLIVDFNLYKLHAFQFEILQFFSLNFSHEISK